MDSTTLTPHAYMPLTTLTHTILAPHTTRSRIMPHNIQTHAISHSLTLTTHATHNPSHTLTPTPHIITHTHLLNQKKARGLMHP